MVRPRIIELPPPSDGVRVSYKEPVHFDPPPERARSSQGRLRYGGPSWYSGLHGKHNSRRTMPPEVKIIDAPERGNSLAHLLPPLQSIAEALKEARPGQVVVITDPCDKAGTARNIGAHAKEKLSAPPFDLKIRTHTLPKDGKFLGAVSIAPEKPDAPAPAPAPAPPASDAQTTHTLAPASAKRR